MTLRRRLVRIDLARLERVRASAERGALLAPRLDDRPELRLNLFEDAVFSTVVERVTPTASGYAVSGRLDGVPLGTLTLVANGAVVAGTVRSPTATYAIRSSGDGVYTIREMDLTHLAPNADRPQDGRNQPGLRGQR